MAIVTIRGQMGSGAPEIGREIARAISGEYVDRQILENVAQLLGRPARQIDEKENIPPRLTRRILAALQKSLERSGSTESAYSHTWQEPLDDAVYLDALESVIRDLALESNIVLVGRGSQFILRSYRSALHVLVVAPLVDRVKRVMAAAGVSEEEARKQIEEYDGTRRAFVRRFFKADLEAPEHYDLVINTRHLTYEAAARMVVATVREKTPWD